MYPELRETWKNIKTSFLGLSSYFELFAFNLEWNFSWNRFAITLSFFLSLFHRNKK